MLKTVEAKRMEKWQSMEEAQDTEELLDLHWIVLSAWVQKHGHC